MESYTLVHKVFLGVKLLPAKKQKNKKLSYHLTTIAWKATLVYNMRGWGSLKQ
jgi:hypothetical protein